MKLNKTLICLLLSGMGVANAQEHVHGAGSAFIVQDGKKWQVQFILPAFDALGFEHSPETEQQHTRLDNLGTILADINNLMQFKANCSQSEFSHNLDEFQNNEHDSHGEHHDRGSIESPNDDNHEHEEHEEEHHQNIEVSYSLSCAKDVSVFAFPIFEQMPSVQKLQLQWSTNRGQGAEVLTAYTAILEL
ncbi:ZrgA family zinc uptake protein [Paraglaciecola sp. 2405UD69-4]|uniref:ZrgA family zinc uptake protein n=1 Tax=Paraglaciecola sp. 2405UD69-4 TaxID=3391836 RepID=UPI0039C8EA9A